MEHSLWAHPLTNTLIAIFVGTIVALLISHRWHLSEFNFALMQQYLSDLDDLRGSIRKARRLVRTVESIECWSFLNEVTEIENTLRSAKREAEVMFLIRGKMQHADFLEKPIEYFYKLSQEIEQAAESGTKAIDKGVERSTFPALLTFIEHRDASFIDQVHNPLAEARNLIFSKVRKF